MRSFSYFIKAKNSKILTSALLAGLLGSGSMQALPLIGIEAGGIVGVNVGQHIRDINIQFNPSDFAYGSYLSYGAYARLWLKSTLRIAPFVKWENVATKGIRTDARFYNIQYGGVVGYAIGGIITPYVGAAYSTFNNGFSNTWALNYGVHITFPVVPIALGIDGSYQQPETNEGKIKLHRVGVTLGLQF